jgi:plasmid stability protein
MVFHPKYDNKTELVTARVPGDLHNKLKERAAEEGKSKSETLVDILRNDLEGQPAPAVGGAFG